MIASVTIENFKSIVSLKVPLTHLTVMLGENGSGKSNVLEGIALGAAAAANKADHEFLTSRGVRTTQWSSMVCRLAPEPPNGVSVLVEPAEGDSVGFEVQEARRTRGWVSTRTDKLKEIRDLVTGYAEDTTTMEELLQRVGALKEQGVPASLPDFLIFSPENTALRTFQREGQILPLGVHGEGLFAHLKWLAEHEPTVIERLNEQLSLITWFDRFTMPGDLGPNEHRLDIVDRFIGDVIDQRSANEGFLFLLFYFTLMLSPRTPRFFAIDNVDASLNPKLCRELISRLAALALETGKQLIVTTHNAAILDGLDIGSEHQSVLVTARARDGRTRLNKVKPPRSVPGSDRPVVPLSEAFMTGLLGGLPDGF